MGIIPKTMYASLILYKLPPKIPQNKANQFCKKLYGQNTSSHKGKYRYHIHGLLDDIPHYRLIHGAFLIKTKDVNQVVAFLRTYTDTVYVREVKLTDDDQHRLNHPLK